ncbi:hypothetical protein ABBQ32_009086 [Trebouxia sp. C0010 RCD-2024]
MFGTTVLFWRKPEHLSDKKGRSETVPVCVDTRHVATPHTDNSVQVCHPIPGRDTESGQQHAEAHQPCASVIMKIVTMPFKTLISRRGAEVHDSAGLNEAVAYYVSASLRAEDRFWAGQHGQARHMWG